MMLCYCSTLAQYMYIKHPSLNRTYRFTRHAVFILSIPTTLGKYMHFKWLLNVNEPDSVFVTPDVVRGEYINLQ